MYLYISGPLTVDNDNGKMPLINKVKAGPLQICVSTIAWKQVYFFTVANNNFNVGFSYLVQCTCLQEAVLTAAAYEAIRKQ